MMYKDESGRTASELFYYCSSCRKFHEDNSHKPVNGRLCFCCGEIKSKKANIVGNSKLGYTQICDKCMKEMDTTGMSINPPAKRPLRLFH